MKSCIYEGRLRHRRFAPVENVFDYPLFMLHLDLAELESFFSRRSLFTTVASFRREDHLGPATEPLDLSVRKLVEARLGRRPEGPVRLLTHLSYFGYGFNPVSFYYCYQPDEVSLEAIVAEVNNTPWGEQHCYVFSASSDRPNRFRFRKDFHVSPFMGMELEYDWRFSAPGASLVVHMESYQDSGRVFDATLSLARVEVSDAALNRRLLRYPVVTFQVMTRIYWQALKLWWKKAPFHAHPDSVTSRGVDEVATR